LLLTGSFAQVSGRSYFLDFSCHSLRKMRFLSMAMTDKYTAFADSRRILLEGLGKQFNTLEF
jgi:hypothetical protein